MLAIELRFVAGRCHATPWGRHVNEADVAWPPDPWRLARALIATWHRKLDPTIHPKAELAGLLEALASSPPSYRLPPAVHAHTRHYMPTRDKPTLVFDAFARVDPDEPLVMLWPALDLSPIQAGLLDALLAGLGYFGRAESWVEARRLGSWTGEPNAIPTEEMVDETTGELLGEAVPLLLPCTPEEYRALRARTLGSIGKLKKKELAQLHATLPEAWIDAIAVDTGDLQAAGWSAPPAAVKRVYRRPLEILRPTAPSRRPAIPDLPSATSARFALYGKPLPRFEDAVRIGELLRIAVLGQAKRRYGEDRIPPLFSGHGLPPDNLRRHAFYLPESTNEREITHLWVHVPGGMDGEMQRVLAGLDRLWERDGGEWRLILEQVGGAAEIAAESPIAGSGRSWRSVTPYLHPWHRKKGFGYEEQLRRECAQRGLPAVEEIRIDGEIETGGRRLHPIQFHRFRSKRGIQQPDRQGALVGIRFEQPIQGPLALGFGCHYGLGLMQRVFTR